MIPAGNGEGKLTIMTALIKIVEIDPRQAKGLIDELDRYQASLYPAQSNHLDSLDVLCNENVTMVGAMENHRLLAIGAVKMFNGYGEIKRVYVPENHRGKGLAKQLMAVLEQRLIEKSIPYAKLETGIYQREAIGLYQRLGYQECLPFGSYRLDPLSVFMSKKLGKEK